MADRKRWVLLTYRLPREPSTPRIALWRKLRRLGAAQVGDGLAALPMNSRNLEQMEWLAEAVADADGDASVWTAEPASAAEGRSLADTMAEAIAQEYSRIVQAALEARDLEPPSRRRTLSRLRREIQRIRARDYFATGERREAEAAVELLAAAVEVTA